MFGSVTANDILVKLSEQGVDIDKKKLLLGQINKGTWAAYDSSKISFGFRGGIC